MSAPQERYETYERMMAAEGGTKKKGEHAAWIAAFERVEAKEWSGGTAKGCKDWRCPDDAPASEKQFEKETSK
jgi:hypothetical protein